MENQILSKMAQLISVGHQMTHPRYVGQFFLRDSLIAEYSKWETAVSNFFAEIGEFQYQGLWVKKPKPYLVNGHGGHWSEKNWPKFTANIEEKLDWLREIFDSINRDGIGKVSADNKREVSGNVNGEIQSKKIFIVHGRNSIMKESIARILEKQGLETIILHEQPNYGAVSVLDKFSINSNVEYAIVLLSDDDIGGIKGEPIDGLQKRARQNVIFEMGYFIGKLGKNRVCAVYCPGVELPSDITGMMYIEYDERGAWKYEILKELKASRIIENGVI